MTIAVALFSVAFNVWGAKRIPAFEGIILFFHIFGCATTPSSNPSLTCTDTHLLDSSPS